MGASHRSYRDRIAELREKQEKLRQLEKDLISRQGVEERKARTRRHIRAGAEIETALGHDIEDDDLNMIRDYIRRMHSREEQTTDERWGIEELDYSGAESSKPGSGRFY